MTTLYHFTCRFYLPTLLQKGITKGDVAIEPDMGFNAPWLTDDPSFSNQPWASNSVFDKTEVRLTVEIDEGDPNLWSWKRLVQEYNIPDYWVRAMTVGIGAKPQHWYIYMRENGISPMRITEVTERKGLPPFDREAFLQNIPEEFARLEHRGEHGKVVRCVRRLMTREELQQEYAAASMVGSWLPEVGEWGVGKSTP